MITMAKAIPYLTMRQMFRKGFDHPATLGYKNVCVISIVNTDFEEPIWEDGLHDNMLALKCDDMHPSSVWKRIDCQNSIELSPDQAEQIVHHIMDFHHKRQEDYILLVNCMMGISRSGAVARWAQEYCGIPGGRFDLLNPQIIPNFWMYNLLYHVYNTMYNSGKSLPTWEGKKLEGFIHQYPETEF